MTSMSKRVPDQPLRANPVVIQPVDRRVALRLGELRERFRRSLPVPGSQAPGGPLSTDRSWRGLGGPAAGHARARIQRVHRATRESSATDGHSISRLCPVRHGDSAPFCQRLAALAGSTLADAQLISKVYFPRILLPAAAAAPALFDFALAFVVLVGVMVAYGVPINPVALVGVPVGVLLATAIAFGFGLWLAAVQVRYRDVQHLIPFVLLVGLFITPIVYPFSLVPEALQPVYALNPMGRCCRLLPLVGTPGPGAVPARAADLCSVRGVPGRRRHHLLSPARAGIRRSHLEDESSLRQKIA